MTNLSGAHVVITGAASGLGCRLARMLAERGAVLSLWDRDVEALLKVSAELESSTAVACDVSDRTAVYSAAARIGKPVDILINNAGVVNGRSFLDIPDEQIQKSFEVNTHSLFWMLKAFLPEMIERNRGHIVTVASAAGLIGVPRLTDYCASKWAAVGLDESLRVELKKRAPGIVTTVVCPYYIDTGMFEGVKTRFPLILPILKEEQVGKKVLRAIENNRPRVLIPSIVYLVSLLRLLPVAWFDGLARFLGISASMDEFVGRK